MVRAFRILNIAQENAEDILSVWILQLPIYYFEVLDMLSEIKILFKYNKKIFYLEKEMWNE